MYRIIRMYFNGGKPRVLKRGLTLEEAQEHCSNPETSSRTCSTATRKRIGQTRVWFDGYERD